MHTIVETSQESETRLARAWLDKDALPREALLRHLSLNTTALAADHAQKWLAFRRLDLVPIVPIYVFSEVEHIDDWAFV